MKKGFIIILVLSIIFSISCDEKSEDAIYINKEIIINVKPSNYGNYEIYWDYDVISNFEIVVTVNTFRLENENFFEKAVQHLLSNNQDEEFEDMYNCILFQSFYLSEGIRVLGFIVNPEGERNYYTLIAFNSNGTFRKSNTIYF